ncbi:MAG: hypothetical protein HY791_16395 [Deltaproteobacteria bacterium]|nr:hypothetical protein [Deltaproteobacteria bacterium]
MVRDRDVAAGDRRRDWPHRRSSQQAIQSACAAAIKGEHARAVELSEGFWGASDDGRVAGECRCVGLAGLGRASECADVVGPAWLSARERWSPSKNVSVLTIVGLRERGRIAEAAELAKAAGRARPFDPEVAIVEVGTRSLAEDEARVLDDVARRLATGDEAATKARLWLAGRFGKRGDADRGLEISGASPPSDLSLIEVWAQTRGRLLCDRGRVDEAIALFEEWKRRGGERVKVATALALLLSTTGVVEAETQVDALERAIAMAEAEPQSAASKDLPTLYARLIGWLVNLDRRDEALSLYSKVSERFEVPGITREMLVRRDVSQSKRGSLDFFVPSPATLWVTTEGSAPDAELERHLTKPEARLRIERAESARPVRWVVADESGTRASGSHWVPASGSSVEIRPVLRPPLAVAPELAVVRAAPDGRRRVLNLILDCGDWRLLRYLLARGELPFFRHLLTTSRYGVLDSRPAFTAAALDTFVYPTKQAEVGALSLIHRMGVELAGLSSIGKNPFESLSLVLPERDSLFEAIGSGPFVTANMLFSHGAIRAGRQAQTFGPKGQLGELEVGSTARSLTSDESTAHPSIAGLDNIGGHARTIAAEMDAAVRIARERKIDLLLLRIEPLDLATHGGLAELMKDRQDDGQAPLLELYRYLDERLTEVDRALDEDDLLIVTSDHGIATSMEHDPAALFFAKGAGLPPGRLEGSPEWRGLPRAIAYLFGVDRTDWPSTGHEAWAQDVRGGPGASPGAGPGPAAHP